MSKDSMARISVRLLDREYQVACPPDKRGELRQITEVFRGSVVDVTMVSRRNGNATKKTAAKKPIGIQ